MTRRTAPLHGNPLYRQLWRVVDGAVTAAFDAHPDYINPTKRAKVVRNSITKRVTGAVTSYAEQSARVRSGSSPADDMERGASPTSGDDGLHHRQPVGVVNTPAGAPSRQDADR